ncbi:MAG: alpha/beta hydrolase family protein [Janthinobacterium lividum]
MIDRRSLLGAAAALSAFDKASAAVAAVPPPPSRLAWRDPARDRVVPVLIRCPATLAGDAGLAPMVVLSHGLGGTREGLAYLGEALAEAGYVAVHLQHPGSDAAIWQGAPDMRSAMGSALMNPGAAVARLGDVVFALDHVLAGGEPLLRGLVDPERIAAAGHSYGAWTVSHVLGERLPLGGWGLDLPDPRLRAGIELSPIPPLPIPVFGVPAAVSFTGISAPILHVTGTLDSGMGAPDWRARTVGFRTATSPGVLAVLDGAAHASFAGEAKIGGRWNDPTYQPRVARLCRLFLDAELRDDQAARGKLLRGAGLGPRDTLESKGFA